VSVRVGESDGGGGCGRDGFTMVAVVCDGEQFG